MAVALVAAVGIIAISALTNRKSALPSGARPSAADRNAPAALVKAADASGFHAVGEPGVGDIEGQPASAASPPSNRALLPVGSRAPGFSLRTPAGAHVSLSRLRGTVVLLEFFATWCPHCQAEAPHLRELQQALPAGTYRFVGINADGESAGSVFAYHRYFGLHFPALLDPGPAQGSFTAPGPPGPVTRAYRVRYYPTFYVVDRSGRIVWRSDGEQPDALLRHELERAAHA